MKLGLKVFLCLGVGFCSSWSSAAQDPVDDPQATCVRENLKESAVVDGYVFRSYQDDGGGCLKVFRDGKVLFRRTIGNNGFYTLGQVEDKDAHAPAIQNGTDITGRGRPDMIVSYYTGGAHCCRFHYVFELGTSFRLVATLSAEDGGYAHFERSNGDRRYHYMANDWTFGYWRTSFASSPAPAVVLQFVDDKKGGSYHLALDKMRRPEPDPKTWGSISDAARAAFGEGTSSEDEINPELWGGMLDLIYTQHSDLAWKLFDEAWPKKRPGKDGFLADFCTQLQGSDYWPDLKKTIRNLPLACSIARSSPGAL